MTILNNIGNTPLAQVGGIWCKCEYLNPSGSIKDRIAAEMICTLKDPKTVIEASSGNTGVSVAFVAAQLGIDAVIVVPENTSHGKIELMMRYGADVVLIDGGLPECCEHAQKLNGIYLNQFANLHNRHAQAKMALEIKRAISVYPNAIVTGIGTAGTLAGLNLIFHNTVFYTPICKDHPIEGTSDGVPLPLKPANCNLVQFPVSWANVLQMKKTLGHAGYYIGYSSAANFLVAKLIQAHRKNIVAIFHDGGLRYEL